MKTTQKIEILNNQLRGIDELANESSSFPSLEHVRWYESTKRCIKSIFGEESEYLKGFASISYGPGTNYDGNSPQQGLDNINAYFSGLESAKTKLLIMIDELSDMERLPENMPKISRSRRDRGNQSFPELQSCIENFHKDHPLANKCAFIMMQFTNTQLHKKIVDVTKASCAAHGIVALRADDKLYSDDLLPNVRTYMHGCGLGIAIFERLTSENFNPNVSLEVGYMMALGKPILLLKDSTLSALHSDLVGRLYQIFDTQSPQESIPSVIEKWLQNKALI